MKTAGHNFVLFLLTLFALHNTAYSQTQEDLQLHELSLSKGGKVLFPAPSDWDVKVNERGQTIKLYSPNRADPISLTVTFLPNKDKRKFSQNERADIVFDISQKYVPGSVEGQVNLFGFQTTIGGAVYSEFNEKKYQDVAVIPPGEYSSITIGIASHSSIIVSFQILSNGTKSEGLELAKAMIASFYITQA